MLENLKNNKILKIGIILLLLPLLCFFLSEVIIFLLNLGRIVGTIIHNINTLC